MFITNTLTNQIYHNEFSESQVCQIKKAPSEQFDFIKTYYDKTKYKRQICKPKKATPITTRKYNHIAKNREYKSGKYRYLQQQLCNTNFIKPKNIKGSGFSLKVQTPFGITTINFRICKDGHVVRFVPCGRGGSSFKVIINRLKRKYTNDNDFENIIKIIYKFLIYNPVKKFSKINNDFINEFYKSDEEINNLKSKYYKEGVNTLLSKFFCIIALCDPCYGKGETGGAELRGILRKIIDSKQNKIQKFDFFLNSYIFAIKNAYTLLRLSATSENSLNDDGNTTEIFNSLISEVSKSMIDQQIENSKPSAISDYDNASSLTNTDKSKDNINDDIELSGINFN